MEFNDLKTKYIGQDIHCFDEVDSTNNEIRRNIDSLCHGSVVIAKKQTNGKGRLGRSWYSTDNGAVYMSILLKPNFCAEIVPQLTLLCGLAVNNALNKVANINAKIKWPNDIVVQNEKICGILCESICNGNEINVIAGIGINVQNKSFPKDIAHKAASIYTVSGETFDNNYIIKAVLEEIEFLYDRFMINPNFLIDEYKSKCISINREIKFFSGTETISGIAYDIDKDGSLIAKDNNGKIYNITSGEVTVQGIY